ncbi:ABC-three component system middle component 8 [Histophilus somni]|uniref:ABC-three component system middle component 8 n=1 Tax=Histophilus somni TaxID=731 RepID=UPI00094B117B|nr:ABC-three component system middle component 8 [Histophilus somni]MBB5151571.1 hypothetical protein [Histophilus somni]
MLRITPDKHTDPDKSIMYTTALLLDALRTNKQMDFSALLSLVKAKTGSDYVLFMPAINLLYLLGLIEYHTKTDRFEYIGK